jgi:hypothetical protein
LPLGWQARSGAAHAAPHYRVALRRRFGRHQRHVALLDQMTRFSPVLEAALRAATRNHRVFDDIATLGLGEGCLTPRLVLGMAAELVRGDRKAMTRVALANDRLC